jgi:hypothetical protein
MEAALKVLIISLVHALSAEKSMKLIHAQTTWKEFPFAARKWVARVG